MSAQGSGARSALLITGTLEAGGAERVLSDMANYWSRRGWRITFATWSSPATPDFYTLDPAIRRVWLDVGGNSSVVTRLWANVTRVRRLRALLRDTKPDVLLSFIDIPNVLALLASAGLGLRTVISERHNPDQTERFGAYEGAYALAGPWRLLRRLLYRRAAAVTALNADAAKWISRECGVPVQVIANPLRVLPEITGEREKLVLGVGRLNVQKGFDLLIDAFSKVAGDFPDWRLLILGNGPDRARLLEQRSRSPFAARIELRDAVRDVEAWMARAGLMVLPSRYEAYGNVMLESLAMGAPTITTRCAGPMSFVVDGVNGRLVPVENTDALAAAMRELMADARARESLGGEGRRVRETHRQELIMDQWEKCLFPAQGQA
jgi:glycosyltransferase involved in cell wall biosynthesis